MTWTKAIKALGRIRFLQRQNRYSIPLAARELFRQLSHSRLDRRIFSRKQVRELLATIDEKMPVILQDGLFAAFQQEQPQRFDAEAALKLLQLLLAFKLEDVFPGVRWEELTFDVLELECREQAPFQTWYRGVVYKGTVSGITRLIGTVRRRGVKQRVFCKFVSHPFYQYGQSRAADRLAAS